MICQSCEVEAPTRKVFLVRHIGASVMFFHKRIGGLFCRNCVNKYSRSISSSPSWSAKARRFPRGGTTVPG